MQWNKPAEPTYPPDSTINNGINYTTKKNIAQGSDTIYSYTIFAIQQTYSLNLIFVCQGMMDIALLTANASQLRYVMRSPYWDIYHQVNIALISISIALQV